MNMQDSPIKLSFGDCNLGAVVNDHEYLFTYDAGGPSSIRIGGKEWLYRSPRPMFWRATTENDQGNGLPQRAAAWYADSQFARPELIQVVVNGEAITLPFDVANNVHTADEYGDQVMLTFRFHAPLSATYCDVIYTVNPDATLHVKVDYPGFINAPELPVFGLQMIMPTPAIGFKYTGLSGETYPDRMLGGIPGTYTVQGLPVTPYLVPQDCGVHMQTSEVVITRNRTLNNADSEATAFDLQISQLKDSFAFSLLPYTAYELDNATHQDELPPARHTVLTVMGAVRGVGGIDSWGSDVQPDYRIDATRPHSFEFSLY